MGRKPTDIIDYLPTRVAGVERRDLEQRLKRLRAARLYPPARSVGDRKAEPVNDQYMANLILALLGSADAKNCAEAVNRLHDLTGEIRAPISLRKLASLKRAQRGKKMTLGAFLISEIRNKRRGKTPRVVDIEAADGEAQVFVSMTSTKDTETEPLGAIAIFGEDPQVQTKREIIVRLTKGVIEALADFLGPLEDSTA